MYRCRTWTRRFGALGWSTPSRRTRTCRQLSGIISLGAQIPPQRLKVQNDRFSHIPITSETLEPGALAFSRLTMRFQDRNRSSRTTSRRVDASSSAKSDWSSQELSDWFSDRNTSRMCPHRPLKAVRGLDQFGGQPELSAVSARVPPFTCRPLHLRCNH
jgi:hypothetical protein